MPKRHVVAQGECSSSIAARFGFANWRKIYDHPENEQLRKKRADPNVLHPGDEVFIPDKDEKHEQVATKKASAFTVKSRRAFCHIVIRSFPGGPMLTGNAYCLAVGNARFSGTIGDDGVIAHRVPPLEEDGELTVWFGPKPEGRHRTWTLKLGHMDPAEEVSGLQERLNRIGYREGPVGAAMGGRTAAALKSFQRAQGLTADGTANDETLAALRKLVDDEQAR